MTAKIAAIYRYPIKGLSAHPMHAVSLTAGETLPFDRAYSIENGHGRFDEANPKHLPKINYLMQMRDERLAKLEARFDETTEILTIRRDGKQVAMGDLGTMSGRAIIEQFFSAYMAQELRGPPKIKRATGHSFSDVSAKCLHIVNLASIKEIERETGRDIDVRRFRPNVVLSGLPAWHEFNWVGQHLMAGSGRLHVFKRTERCAATDVNPANGVRDIDIPALLWRKWGHHDFGVYARVVESGLIRNGDAVAIDKTDHK
jgi:uncharacterized protein